MKVSIAFEFVDEISTGIYVLVIVVGGVNCYPEVSVTFGTSGDASIEHSNEGSLDWKHS